MRNVNAFGGDELDGVYNAVLDARWHPIAKFSRPLGVWEGMHVFHDMSRKKGNLWSEAQANAPYDSEEPWEGDEVPGVGGKLVMVVLSSQKGWPHMLFDGKEVQLKKVDSLTGSNAACDAYIRKEDVRVWYIVNKGLDECVEGKGMVHPFIVIGTSGIGKSSATGSFLLYQLLHYPSEWLKVVAYFVKGEAYLFHREEKRVVHYGKQGAAVGKIEHMISSGIKGYIIFDIGEGSSGMERLPRAWGIVLISSPDVKVLHKFKAQRPHTVHIYINCYEDAEFEAVLAWERQRQWASDENEWGKVNPKNEWEVVKKRIHMVGPLPRYVLGSEKCFSRRVADVKAALSEVFNGHAERYAYLLSNPDKWHMDGTTNILVKLFRVRSGWPEVARNKAVCTYVHERILKGTMETFARRELRDNALVSREERCVSMFKASGLRAFTIGSVVTEMVRHLKYLPREGETERSRSSVLCRPAARGGVPPMFHRFSSADTPVEMVAEYLYKPAEKNFPVVGGFFLVDAVGEGVSLPEGAEAPTQTIVLLQVTKARDNHTTTSEVCRFRERMAASFTNWREMESRLSYEIIYVQHADSTSINDRQRCDRSGMADDAAIEQFWSEVSQLQMKLEAPITQLFLEEMCGTGMAVETGGDIVRDLCDANITAVAGADTE
ncbi:unnamed protein product [Trypanosoma congolense IL3000]|uniref:WGS project CAEQ00000000 data, annotated contig 1904 n=1 Tax=Trypanosoma congolense (strain IL3000) TaxID=1068625 RepID=F9W9V9_TRYCI|nr:unnamed protein product [Trypanosoma congolense IL3000]